MEEDILIAKPSLVDVDPDFTSLVDEGEAIGTTLPRVYLFIYGR